MTAPISSLLLRPQIDCFFFAAPRQCRALIGDGPRCLQAPAQPALT